VVTNGFSLYEAPGLGLHDFMDETSHTFKEQVSPILRELIHEIERKGGEGEKIVKSFNEVSIPLIPK